MPLSCSVQNSPWPPPHPTPVHQVCTDFLYASLTHLLLKLLLHIKGQHKCLSHYVHVLWSESPSPFLCNVPIGDCVCPDYFFICPTECAAEDNLCFAFLCCRRSPGDHSCSFFGGRGVTHPRHREGFFLKSEGKPLLCVSEV